jgi:formamidopyrimidine-DNA glycosylase
VDFAKRLEGRQIIALGRRAKYLIADLDDGMVLVSHLGMSGSFRIEPDGDASAEPGVFHHRARKMTSTTMWCFMLMVRQAGRG